MATLASDLERAAAMGVAGRRRAEELFSRQTFVERLGAVCLALHTAPPPRGIWLLYSICVLLPIALVMLGGGFLYTADNA